jgi:putative ABC transport system permease protein
VVSKEDAMRDLRLAVRQLARTPGFSAVAVVTLALGIGACAAIFSVVDGVLLRPLPYPRSERLVVVQETLLPRFAEFAVAPSHYLAWREQATSFESLAALHDGGYNVTTAGGPVHVAAKRVTASLFTTLQVAPALGRAFSPEEDLPGNASVAVVSHDFWMRYLGGRPEVLGETVTLDGRPFAVVGVMPPGFQIGGPADIFTPAAYGPSGVHDIGAIARLRDGVTLAEARSEMALLAERLGKTDARFGHWGVKLTAMRDFAVRDVRAALLALLGAVGLLLLVACANVANLLLARALVRSREIAVRTALGASRGQVVRQVLTESLVLALAGGAAGVLLAKAAVAALLAAMPRELPRLAEIGVDARVLGFACLLALATGVAFGVLPALHAARVDPNDVLKQGGHGAGVGRRQSRLRGGLLAAEVALALVLLVGAGLLMRSFARLQAVDPGFRPEGVLAVTLSLPESKYPTGAEQAAFAERAAASLAALPGVQAAAASQGFPFSTVVNHVFGFRIAGRPPERVPPIADAFSVTPGYFAAMGIQLRRGRLLDARDGARSPRVALINETLARRIFPDEDPIGKRIDAARAPGAPDRWHEIVGVVGDVRYARLDGQPAMQGYAPFVQAPADWGALTLVVRAPGAVSEEAIRAAIRAVDGGQAITTVRPATDWIAGSIARQRFAMLLFVVFSVVALLLAAIGVYAVMAQVVAQRTRELAIRVALGARTADVLRLVLAQGGRHVALGLAVGLATALALTRFLTSLLFGVTPHDPLTFAGVAAFLAVVALLACLLPARRASAVDPMHALRAE